MKCTILLLLFCAVYAIAAPAENSVSSPAPKQGSPFISSFDEIVVESTLMVRGRNSPGRQGRTKLVAVTTTTTTAKPSTDSTSTSSTTTKASV